MVELEPERSTGGLRHVFHAVVRRRAEHHQGVGHPGPPCRGALAIWVCYFMAASGADHDREADGGAQYGRRQLALGHIAQEAWTQADGVKGRAVAPGGQLVLGATGDKIPVIVRQHLLGARLVVIQIDGVYTHTALRAHIKNRVGELCLRASISHHLTKEKLIIFIVAAKILMLVLRPSSRHLSWRLGSCYAHTRL